ncbi:hypothetical protein LX16_4444 [Stackebrandtia albiflava]|uniref:YbaB/EbfC DNA-binding family protein n=1 Tax=Stackebrandtia albiflava TaxID=406432 RepID=A0A562URI7_9ACTN|nr:YbaB/EbfC family nucleoid-associated protein [Stackebrandtia albiflava]TWJ08221.1 hypothetical protein LX16_4444 [Stackebrandtia albiflava]
MGELLDAVNAIRVRAYSSDRTVRATVTRRTDTRVAFSPSARDLHDEPNLASRISEAVEAAWIDGRKEMEDLLRRRNIGIGTAAAKLDRSQTDTLFAKTRAIRAVGESDRGHVAACVVGEGRLRIRFHGNAVRRTDLPTETLEAEVNQAIRRARAKWGRELMRVYHEVAPPAHRPRES